MLVMLFKIIKIMRLHQQVTEGAYISFDHPNIVTLRVVGSGYVSYEYWDSESESYVDTVSSLRVRLQYNDGGIWKNENSVFFTQTGIDTTLGLGQNTMDKNLRLVTSPTYINILRRFMK